jgi:hypothetical protein
MANTTYTTNEQQKYCEPKTYDETGFADENQFSKFV